MNECTFEGCDKAAWAKGLCHGHYQQQRRGTELKPLRVLNTIKNGMKVCTVCGEDKPLSEYSKQPQGGPLGRCKPCNRKASQERYRKMAALVAKAKALGLDAE